MAPVMESSVLDGLRPHRERDRLARRKAIRLGLCLFSVWVLGGCGSSSSPADGPSASGGSAGGIGNGGTGGRPGTGGAAVRPDGAVEEAPFDAEKDSSVLDSEWGRDTSGREANGTEPASTDITVWLAGDSTVADGLSPCPVGWGKELHTRFNPHVTVKNRAIGGRSVQTWLFDVTATKGTDGECVLASKTYLASWTEMLADMKPGDYLLIQFGINDSTPTCNRHVGPTLFQKYYGMMAQAATDRGAHPIFLTPVSGISCKGAQAAGTRGTYATAAKQAGATYDVPVIDLEALSVALYSSLGFCPLPGPDTASTFESGAIGDFFCEDHTHFEAAGARRVAGLIAQALMDQRIGLGSYLK